MYHFKVSFITYHSRSGKECGTLYTLETFKTGNIMIKTFEINPVEWETGINAYYNLSFKSMHRAHGSLGIFVNVYPYNVHL